MSLFKEVPRILSGKGLASLGLFRENFEEFFYGFWRRGPFYVIKMIKMTPRIIYRGSTLASTFYFVTEQLLAKFLCQVNLTRVFRSFLKV